MDDRSKELIDELQQVEFKIKKFKEKLSSSELTENVEYKELKLRHDRLVKKYDRWLQFIDPIV